MTIASVVNDDVATKGALSGLSELFDGERERWALWSPVLMGAGIAAYFAMPFEPPVWSALSLPILASVVFLLRTRWSILSLFMLAALLAATGFTTAQVRSIYVAAPVLAKAYGPAPVQGRVVRLESFATSSRILLDQVRLRGIAESATPQYVRIRLNRSEQPVLGTRVSVFAKLMPPSAPVIPGGYDFRRRAWFERLGGVGFAMGGVRLLENDVGAGEPDLRTGVAIFRQGVTDRIRAAVPGAAGAVAAALITGDRSAIPTDVIDAMRNSGLAHLLAISGLHMGLVAACLFLGFRILLAVSETVTLRFPIKKWAAVFALVGSAGYLILAGATVPTQRAFLMTGLVLIAVFFDRIAISLRLVAWAAAVILLTTPESLLGASFQMSFAAVVALVSVYEQGWRPMKGRFGSGWPGRLALYFGGVALTTLIAGAVTGLFAMYHFGRITHFGLAANLLAVPMTALWIMPWAVVSLLLMPFGLEALGLVPMGWGIEQVIGIADTVGHWPGAVSLVPTMPSWGLAAIALGGLWLCLWRLRWRYLGIVGIVAGLLSMALHTPPDVLVSDDGGVMAVRSPEGELVMNNNRRDRRVVESWLTASGQQVARYGGGEDVPATMMSCDPLACVAHLRGQAIALVENARALQEDCSSADIVISAVPVRGLCRSAGLVIDRFDLWRHGAHAVWINPPGRPVVKTVADDSGTRPWSPARAKASRAGTDQ